MTKASDNLFPGIIIRESANDGSDFSNPSADYRRLFLGEDGELHLKDSAGAVTDVDSGAGAVATDAIWDAAGDLVQGTGANTAAKLTLGAAGTVVRSTGSTNAYAFPPGHEFDYAEITSPVSITATSEATADTVVTGNAVTYDGSTIVMVEYWFPYATQANPDNNLIFVLYDGSSSIGLMGMITSPTATGYANNLRPGAQHGRRRLTPSAAGHTYSIRAFTAGGTQSVGAGAGGGGGGAHMPGFIRVTKAT